MGTTRGMHMMIAGKPTEFGHVYPSLQAKYFSVGGSGWYFDRPPLDVVFRTSRVFHVVRARRQMDRFAAVAINLVMKEKVRRHAA